MTLRGTSAPAQWLFKLRGSPLSKAFHIQRLSVSQGAFLPHAALLPGAGSPGDPHARTAKRWDTHLPLHAFDTPSIARIMQYKYAHACTLLACLWFRDERDVEGGDGLLHRSVVGSSRFTLTSNTGKGSRRRDPQVAKGLGKRDLQGAASWRGSEHGCCHGLCVWSAEAAS